MNECRHPESHRKLLMHEGREYYQFWACLVCGATGKMDRPGEPIGWNLRAAEYKRKRTGPDRRITEGKVD